MKKLFLIGLLSLFFAVNSWAMDMTVMQMVGSGSSAYCSGTYGDTSGANSSSVTAFIIRLRPITIDCDSPANYSIKAVLWLVNTAAREIKFLIYDDDGAGGDAGTRLYESNAMYDGNTTGDFAIVECSSVSTSLSSGKYWVGILYESPATVSQFQYDGTTGAVTLKHVQGDFTSPATWDTGNDSTSTTQDCYYLDF